MARYQAVHPTALLSARRVRWLLLLLAAAVVLLYLLSPAPADVDGETLRLRRLAADGAPPVASPGQSAGRHPVRVLIKLLAYNRLDSLRRTVASLQQADYLGERVDLHVYLDRAGAPAPDALAVTATAPATQNATQMLAFCHGMVWPYGEKLVHFRSRNVGTQGAWMEAWWPSSAHEFAFFVEDDTAVSPAWYAWMRRAIDAYYYAPREAAAYGGGAAWNNSSAYSSADAVPELDVYGITLQRNMLVPGKFADGRKRSVQYAGAGEPFLYQLLGTWGQLMFPHHWASFRLWYEGCKGDAKRSVALAGLITTDWYGKLGERIWTPYFIRYVHMRRWYTVCTDFAGGGALSISFQETGVSYRASAGADATLIAGAEAASLPLLAPLPEYAALQRRDFCFRRVPRARFCDDVARLPEFLAAVSLNRTLIITTATEAFESMLRNWMCSVRNLGISHFVVYTQEEGFARRLHREGVSVILDRDDGELVEQERRRRSAGNASEGLRYGTLAYQLHILKRTQIVNTILGFDYGVLLADNDAVWQSDPFAHMTDASADFFGSMDYDRFCGGFLYLRATSATRLLWQTLTDAHRTLIERAILRGTLENINDSEQSLLRKLVAKFPQLRAVQLDTNLFPNGKQYFQHRIPQGNLIVPAVIHNNWVIGKENKIARWKAEGLWQIADDWDNGCKVVRC